MEIIEMATIINSKGQFIIPSKIRKQLGIKEKWFLQIEVDVETRRIILTPLRGKYKGKGLIKTLLAEKKRERNL
jgi:bifunctional DNA-binding transcriptional regulator/antitoxin component of YhaV-PrlF toxin-antitoxin module